MPDNISTILRSKEKKLENKNFYEIQTPPPPLTVNIFTHLQCNISLDQDGVNNKSHNTRKFTE
jgi:hypothetical protein